MTTNSTKFDVKHYVFLPLVVLIALITWLVPIPGLTATQHGTLAIFVFAALAWMFEIIPAWTTSVCISVVMLLTISDAGIPFFRDTTNPNLGNLVSYKSILATYADPTVMLFLGGFVLAIACSKVGFDVRLARTLLTLFGKKSEFVLLGFLMVIGFLSMFMSNTATAAMMLAILAPVLKTLPADGKGKLALALSIPIAANIGGIGTPIGTPPNAIAFGYLNESLGMTLTFGTWAVRMIPFVIVMLLFAWVLLLWMFPFKAKTIELKIEGDEEKGWHQTVVIVTFFLTIFLWCFEEWIGIKSNVVAMIPVGVFCATGVITTKDLKEIEWSVLWLVAGGFALGLAMDKTGLMSYLVNALPIGSWSAILVLLIPGVIAYFISNFISNTAAASLLVPIIGAVAKGMSSASLEGVGGYVPLIAGAAVVCSLAMLFPISTPPNAIAHSTGLLSTKDMIKVGLPIGVVGYILGYVLLYLTF